MSGIASHHVLLKMDALQPSGSFKDRGMAALCTHLKDAGAARLVSSSGGNAGLACASAGRVLGMDVTVVVPKTTKPLMLEKMRAHGADVIVHGENWNEADERVRSMVEEDEKAKYVHPFDDPLLWAGHSTMIDEIREDMFYDHIEEDPGLEEERPAAIVACVGGGGMLCGIYEGLKLNEWTDVPVIAAETEGAACFATAIEHGSPVRLDAITSIATSLGALQVSSEAFERSKSHPTTSIVSSDAEVVSACIAFASDHHLLVEPACAAALAAVYSDRHRETLGRVIGDRKGPIVVIVCGGSGVDVDLISQWKRDFL